MMERNLWYDKYKLFRFSGYMNNIVKVNLEESMEYKLISDFSNKDFQQAFQQYFSELGINVKDWEGLFKEMNEDSGTTAYLLYCDMAVVGFVQFKQISLTNWFFEEKLGFIRELWIAKEFRKKGTGKALLRKAEEYFMEQGIRKVILTTDDSAEFYLKQGYEQGNSYSAKNNDEVYVKYLKECRY